MKIFSEDTVKVGDVIYLFGVNINILYSINLKDGNVSFIAKLPEENILKKRLICKILYWESKLYLIPLDSRKIWIFSLLDKSWKSIEILEYENNWAKSYLKNAVIYKNDMFLFGGYYPAILKLDMKTLKIAYVKEPFINKDNTKVRDAFFRGEPLQIENKVYLASCIDNTVLVFDMENAKYHWIKVGNKKNRYSGIVKSGNDFWLSSRHTPMVIKWNGKDKVIEYRYKDSHFLKLGHYIGIIKMKNSFIIPSLKGSNNSSIILYENGNFYIDKCQYSFFKKIENEYFFQTSDGKIHYIDKNGIQKVYINNFENSKELILDLKKHDKNFHMDLQNVFQEDEPFSIDEWFLIIFDF